MILIRTLRYSMFREIALHILLEYYQNGGYLNILINHALNKGILESDKAKVTRIVYGTVQNQLYLSYILKKHVHVRMKSYEKMLLLLSMYQHFFMDSIPDYAICNEAVRLAKKEKGKKTANFINAVLKNVFKDEVNLDDLEEVERLSIETSHPLWLVNMLIKQYGLDTTRKICISNNEIPYQCARVNTLMTKREEILKNPLYTKAKLSLDGVYYSGGNIANTKEYKDGLLTIQDESSQLVAPLLAPKRYERVLDMCCAPGGKTSHMAVIMENEGHIDAIDLYEHKIKLVKEQLERLHVFNVQTYVYNSLNIKEFFDDETFDCILLDAPCSGLGDLRRKPEIRYHDSSIMDELIIIQKKLLENAYDLLKKGGRMVYSTCTINKKENEKQVQAFLLNHPDLIKMKEQTILPYEYHSDGFYMCLIAKER